MKFGMSSEQFDLLNKLVIEPLKSRGAEVFIFGSRTTGRHHSHSDVDILYRAPSGGSFPSGFVSGIKEAIEDSAFPFTVDLVEESALASSYRESVFAGMKPV